jgi:hypothetical protein
MGVFRFAFRLLLSVLCLGGIIGSLMYMNGVMFGTHALLLMFLMIIAAAAFLFGGKLGSMLWRFFFLVIILDAFFLLMWLQRGYIFLLVALACGILGFVFPRGRRKLKMDAMPAPVEEYCVEPETPKKPSKKSATRAG